MLRRLAGLWEERSGVTWRSSAAIKGCGTRRLSVAIKGQSIAIKGQSRGNQWQSRGNQWGNQLQSMAIKGQSMGNQGISSGNQGTLGSLWHWYTGTHYQGHTTEGTQ